MLSNRFASAALIAALLSLVGCGGKNTRPQVAEPVATAPTEIRPLDRAEFDAGIKLMREGHLDQAQLVFESLLHRSDDFPGVFLNLALIHQKHAHLDEALSFTDRALAVDPSPAGTHNLRGSLLRKLGRFQEAEQAYLEAIKRNPSYSAAHLNLGILYDIYLRQWDSAKRQYLRYLEVTEKPDPKVKYWLIDLEGRLQRAGG